MPIIGIPESENFLRIFSIRTLAQLITIFIYRGFKFLCHIICEETAERGDVNKRGGRDLVTVLTMVKRVTTVIMVTKITEVTKVNGIKAVTIVINVRTVTMATQVTKLKAKMVVRNAAAKF